MVFKIRQYRNRCYLRVSYPHHRKHPCSNLVYSLLNTEPPPHLRKINYFLDGVKIPAVIKYKVILLSTAMWNKVMEETSDLHRTLVLRCGLSGPVPRGWTSCSSAMPPEQLVGYVRDSKGSA